MPAEQPRFAPKCQDEIYEIFGRSARLPLLLCLMQCIPKITQAGPPSDGSHPSCAKLSSNDSSSRIGLQQEALNFIR